MIEIGGLQLAWEFPVVVALAIFVNMVIAATIGTLIPMFFGSSELSVGMKLATGTSVFFL